MPVEDVFSTTGRATVATGRVEAGVLHVSDEVEIVGIKEETRKVVAGGRGPVRPPRDRERMAVGIPGVRKRGAAVHGRETIQRCV